MGGDDMILDWVLWVTTFLIGFAIGYFRRHEEEIIEKVKRAREVKEKGFGQIPEPTAEEIRDKKTDEGSARMFDKLFGGKK